MNPIRTVALATDFSPGARPAATRAAQIAHAHQASLTLAHVFEQDVLTALRDLVTGRDVQAEFEAQARTELASLASAIGDQHGISVDTVLRKGSPHAELMTAAHGADVLVLGAQGSHPVRHFALGSTAERLSRIAERPLLVVRNEPIGRYRRALVAVDFSEASMHALQAALRLAPGAAIHLVHCFTVPFESRLRMADVPEEQIDALRKRARAAAVVKARELLVQAAAPGRISVRQGDARLEVLAAADEDGADLIVVGKQGRSLLADTLIGSVTSWLLREASCDVLVVPAKLPDDA